MDNRADEIQDHFHDLLTTMKRRNRHIVPLGNGGVRIIDLPDLYKQTGLYPFHAASIYRGALASNFSFPDR